MPSWRGIWPYKPVKNAYWTEKLRPFLAICGQFLWKLFHRKPFFKVNKSIIIAKQAENGKMYLRSFSGRLKLDISRSGVRRFESQDYREKNGGTGVALPEAHVQIDDFMIFRLGICGEEDSFRTFSWRTENPTANSLFL